MWKLAWVVVGQLVVGLLFLNLWFDRFVRFVLPYLEAFIAAVTPKPKQPTEEEERESERQMLLTYLREETRDWYAFKQRRGGLESYTYDVLCGLSSSFRSDDEECRAIFDNLVAVLRKRDEAAKLAAEKRKAWIVFWVNFSSVFIKWGLNLGYVGLAALLTYFAVVWLPPLAIASWDLLVWCVNGIFTIDFFNILYLFAIWAFRILLIVGGFLALGVVIVRRNEQIRNGLGMVFGPLAIIPKVGGAVLGYCLETAENVCQFCVSFYEESCPPIKIVTEDDE